MSGRISFRTGNILTVSAWLLYSAVVCLVYVGQMSDLALDRNVSWQIYFAATAGLALALICIVYVPFRLLSLRLRSAGWQMKRIGTIEGLLFILNMAISIGIRIFLIVQNQFRVDADAQLLPTGLLEGQEFMIAGAQLLLQISALVLLYFACRALAGRLIALFTVATASVFTLYHWNVLIDTVRSFLFCMLLFCLSQCIYGLKRTGQNVLLVWGKFCFCGMAAGIASWTDWNLVSLLLLGISAILMFDGNISCAGRILRLLLPFTAGFTVGFGGSVLWTVWRTRTNQDIFFMEWMTAEHKPAFSFSEIYAQGWQLYLFLPLLALSFLFIFGFFEQPERRGSIWLLPFIFVTVTNALLGVPLAGQSIGLIYWTVMAGMGLHSIIFGEGEHKMKLVSGRKKKAKAEEPVSSLAVVPLPGEPIDNPLPVPKKHVRKEIDFAFEPKPEQMHFDLDNLSADDDFDIV